MEHIAIDLGGRKSQICVRKEDGEIVEERRVDTRSLPHYLRRRHLARVVMETCSEAFWVADAALEAGHEVRVVPATLVRSLGVGARGTKTDRRDAQALSAASCRIDLPAVHIPAAASRRLKTMCSMREALVTARTKLVNCVRGWLRAQNLSAGGRSTPSFPARVRTVCSERLGAVPVHVERLLIQVEQLTGQIRDADKELAGLARDDERTRAMMTAPGVGPVVSLRYAAALDRIDRFPSAHAVESYLGLVPGERSSSDRTCRTGITKAGAPMVRCLLVQAAWCAWRTRPADPMVRWAQQVALRRGKKVAITALARKLAGVLYALWRDGGHYDPRRGAKAIDGPSLDLLLASSTPLTDEEATG